MIISKRIRRVYSPLNVTVDFVVAGSALSQVYKSIELAYEPSRAITPTLITPVVLVNDVDGVFGNGNANRKLGALKWYVNGVDVTTMLDYTNGLYLIDQSDTTSRGTLTILKNVAAAAPISLSFAANLPDARRGVNIGVSIKNILLTTQDVTADKYTVEINQPVEYTINPLTAGASQVINAVVYRGVNLLPNSTAGLSFKIYYMNGTTPVLATAVNCPELVQNIGAFTFDLRMIQKKDYMIKLFDGVPEVASVQLSILRSYPVYTLALRDYGDVRKNQQVIPGTAIIQTRGSAVANAGTYFTIEWHTVSTSKGDLKHNLGVSAEIPTDKTGLGDGAIEVYCTVVEKPAMEVASDSLGEGYTDSLGEQYIYN